MSNLPSGYKEPESYDNYLLRNNNIDYDAIYWAYHKLLAFGLDNSVNMDTCLMMDKLKLMILIDNEENK